MNSKLTETERNRLISINRNLESEIAINNMTLIGSHKMNESEMKALVKSNLELGNKMATNEAMLLESLTSKDYDCKLNDSYQNNQENYHLFGNHIRETIKSIKYLIREYKLYRLKNPQKGKFYSMIGMLMEN